MKSEEFATSYASRGPHWEDWYEEYLYGACYLFPPEPLRSRVNALRSHYDPKSQAFCDAHVSLTIPLPRPLTLTAASELEAVLRSHAAFEVAWGPPYQYPGIPGVVLRIEPAPTLTRLVEALERCSAFTGAPPRRYPFSPHMTIAEFIDLGRTEEILRELDSSQLIGSWTCAAISYAVPDQDFRFTERLIWPFHSSAGAS